MTSIEVGHGWSKPMRLIEMLVFGSAPVRPAAFAADSVLKIVCERVANSTSPRPIPTPAHTGTR